MTKPYVDPFNMGYQAHLDGKDEYDCPFDDDYRQSVWQHGIETAQADAERDAAKGLRSAIARVEHERDAGDGGSESLGGIAIALLPGLPIGRSTRTEARAGTDCCSTPTRATKAIARRRSIRDRSPACGVSWTTLTPQRTAGSQTRWRGSGDGLATNRHGAARWNTHHPTARSAWGWAPYRDVARIRVACAIWQARLPCHCMDAAARPSAREKTMIAPMGIAAVGIAAVGIGVFAASAIIDISGAPPRWAAYLGALIMAISVVMAVVQ